MSSGIGKIAGALPLAVAGHPFVAVASFDAGVFQAFLGVAETIAVASGNPINPPENTLTGTAALVGGPKTAAIGNAVENAALGDKTTALGQIATGLSVTSDLMKLQDGDSSEKCK